MVRLCYQDLCKVAKRITEHSNSDSFNVTVVRHDGVYSVLINDIAYWSGTIRECYSYLKGMEKMFNSISIEQCNDRRTHGIFFS